MGLMLHNFRKELHNLRMEQFEDTVTEPVISLTEYVGYGLSEP
jgi:hypothetical protein